MLQTSNSAAAMLARRLAAGLALAIACVAPASAAGDTYVVAATISHDGSPIGEPEMRVATDTTATVSVTGDERHPGDVGYQLSILLRPSDDQGDISVQVELATTRGRIESTSTATLGEPLTIARGAVGLEVLVTRDGN